MLTLHFGVRQSNQRTIARSNMRYFPNGHDRLRVAGDRLNTRARRHGWAHCHKSFAVLTRLIRQADDILIGAGAGVGVDSGLPDLRSDAGFWRSCPPLTKAGEICLARAANIEPKRVNHFDRELTDSGCKC